MAAKKSSEPVVTPFPEIRPITAVAGGLKSGENITLYEPVLLTRNEARDLVQGIVIEMHLPDLTAGLMLHPYEFGYVGTPFCGSSDPRVTCFPQGPGPDDDPRGYVCVCFGPDLEDDRPGPPRGGFQLPEPCILEIQPRRGKFRLGCRNRRCSQTCRMGRISSISGWIIGCTCQP